MNFTNREQQVLNLLLDGNSNREIAQSLKIEERTVKSYVTKLMQKMGVKNRTALTMRAQDRSTTIRRSPSPLRSAGRFTASAKTTEPAIK